MAENADVVVLACPKGDHRRQLPQAEHGDVSHRGASSLTGHSRERDRDMTDHTAVRLPCTCAAAKVVRTTCGTGSDFVGRNPPIWQGYWVVKTTLGPLQNRTIADHVPM
ncbi:hypothetical protein [Streptomyces sp. NPDC096132]|uniref:hypothetical protein n=1 Tax=Streptomyces sp. NPDC096132 TaxID=3366075 RepID=UPI003827E474